MSALNLVIDTYERRARLYPALLVLAPVIVAALAIAPVDWSTAKGVVGILVTCGGAYFLAQVARDAGKRREPGLWAAWGGAPSTAVLRHADGRIDPITKARYHRLLASLVEGAPAPSPDEERGNCQAADNVYAAWSNFIRTHTRDTKRFSLLFQENVSYGYRRNVWGMRWIGAAVAALAALACGWQVWRYATAMSAAGAALLACCVMLAAWGSWFTRAWVRIPADAYALRLVEACEHLQASAAPKPAARAKKKAVATM